jgi:hypothetical protein
MKNFNKSVPFDPGFSDISFSFIGNIENAKLDYNSLRANHQKKFWMIKFESTIIDFINKSSAFYLGCILWGGFIHYRFKDSPKDIIGNNTINMSETELKELDCTQEVKAILEYIEEFDKNCKYFLRHPAKISPLIKEILNSYIEFVQLNNNFINICSTKDIKTPKEIQHFKGLSNAKLDELCEKIYSAIKSDKIEFLLEIGFYNV